MPSGLLLNLPLSSLAGACGQGEPSKSAPVSATSLSSCVYFLNQLPVERGQL